MEEDFVQVVPNQSEPIGFRYTVRATQRGKEIVLCQTNDAHESFYVFTSNQRKYSALCWSINHEVQDEKLSVSNRVVRWFRKLW